MLSYLQAIVLGLVQGVTELFPISSLGHSVILPSLLGWHINQTDPLFLTFLVATHLATSLVLIGFYFADWVLILKGFVRSLLPRTKSSLPVSSSVFADPYARLGWLIIVATIPAGILGLLFQNKLSALFASPKLVACVLIINGFALYAVEVISRKKRLREQDRMHGEPLHPKLTVKSTGREMDVNLAKLTWSQSFKIGLAQCLALIPGFSRTGMTLGGGILSDLKHEDAARFSFQLATPIIFAAAVLKLPSLTHLASDGNASLLGPFFAGAIAAALGTYFSVRFLTRYFKTRTLMPFAIYCIVFGALTLLLLIK